VKRSLSHGAGYLVVDHRDSPGISPADVAHVPGAIPVPGGELLERDAIVCAHCQKIVVLEPGRVRARAHCPKCDAYICDACEAARVAAGGACVPFKAVLDHAAEIAEKHSGDPEHPALTALEDPTTLQTDAAPAPRVIVP